MNNTFTSAQTFKAWIPLAVVTTLMSGLVCAAVQQNFRQSANDPQIQMAEDFAAAWEKGQDPKALAGTNQIDIAKSLKEFVVFYDASAISVAANASLDNEVPSPPTGVFSYTLEHGQDRLTWQPQKDVRIAVVVQSVNEGKTGYVLVGRSLREVEMRENKLTQQVLAAWIITLAASLLAVIGLEKYLDNKEV
jgi:hypothetical protein